MINSKKLLHMIDLVKECNKCAMLHFHNLSNDKVEYKNDNSPLTQADLEVNQIAVNGIKKLFPSVKIVSEEFERSQQFFQNNNIFWLIDPIDGTKEFINKKPNFTVNFALIKNNSPIFGLISQPYTGNIWYNFKGKAWRLENNQNFENSQRIQCNKIDYNNLKILSSFNHRSIELENWISFVNPVSDQDIGSSIKFCYLAEGQVDFYPRTSPTMEWDIAAGHSILKAAGGNIVSSSGFEMRYGKENFKNRNFLAYGLTDNLPCKFLLNLSNTNNKKYEIDLTIGVKALNKKELVAFPTETVYGIGAIGNSKKAIRSIYSAKNRPLHNPLIAHTYNKEEAEKYVQFTDIAHKLTNKFWPGPLTIILQTKKNNKSNILSQNKSSLGIRVPSHPVALDLLERIKIPVLAPSANKSGGVSPTTAKHVIDDFGPNFKGEGWKLSKIIDYGFCEVGIESTVVDCRGENPIILRHGYITTEMIFNILKTKVLDVKNKKELISPGLLKSHYSPNANVFLNQKSNMGNSGWLIFGETPKSLQKKQNLFNLSPNRNLIQACYLLFSGLRYLDSCGVENIQVMPIPNKGVGIAINDRLKRASYKTKHIN